MSSPRSRHLRAIALGAALTTLVGGTVLAALPAQAISPDVVLSEIYGGGGNSGALLKQDFVELRNNSASAVSLVGWSVQYASATGGTWQVTPLTGSIAPGSYYLVAEAPGAGGTIDLPTPDVTGTIAMSATAGKVALSTGTTPLTGICGTTCSTNPAVRDFVGFGTTAGDFEGAGRAPAPSNTTSDTRDATGTDTDNNNLDFTILEPPLPTNSAGETPDYGGEEDPIPLTIMEIQGGGHLSTEDGVLVETTGVATAVSSNGYWIQDPTGDSDVTTSDGIFVFTNTGGAKPTVGDALTVTGTVDEFRPGGATGPGLNITEISGSSFVVTGSGVPLPDAAVFGPAGALPPPDVIDNDSPTRIDIEVAPPASFNPAEDAIDFYEQFEGMLVQLNTSRALGPTNSFGEIVALIPGPNDYVRSANDGVIYTSYDKPNARRLILDDVIIGAGNMPMVNTGDKLDGPIVGPLDYGFNNWRMYPTSVPGTTPGDTVRESTTPAPVKQLSVSTFNVENLDPGDDPAKFAALAEIIVTNLAAPDIVALEEVQDNNGAVNDGTVAADQTLDQFVAAITAAGGPTYQWEQINPVDGQDGGEPGGNIRVAFLYRTDRGLSFTERGEPSSTEPTEVTTIGGEVAITRSPGRVDPANPAWDATRKPLVGEFRWRGASLFVIANHFSSKGGDEPLSGRWQPPTRSSEAKRQLQAGVVNGFVQDLLDVDPDANVVVLGDINDFEFSETVDVLTDGGADLADLIQFKKPKQRWTYIFEGNSQVLDHILVGPSFAPRADQRPVRIKSDYDIVHVNADFYDQVSDHDPQVVRLRFGSGTP